LHEEDNVSRIKRRVIVSRRLTRAFLAQVSRTPSPEVVVFSSRPNVFVRTARQDPAVDGAIHFGRVAYRVSKDSSGRAFISFIGDPTVLRLVRAVAEDRGLTVEGRS
jgi:hypothetical protein